MKKYLASTIITLALGLAYSMQTQAATWVGTNCTAIWGTVSYIFVDTSNPSNLVTVINNTSCIVATIEPSQLTTAAALLTEAQSSGKRANISIGVNGNLAATITN